MKGRALRKLAEDLRGFVQAKGRIRRDVWVEARDEDDLLYLKEEVLPDLGLELVSVQPQIGMLVVKPKDILVFKQIQIQYFPSFKRLLFLRRNIYIESFILKVWSGGSSAW